VGERLERLDDFGFALHRLEDGSLRASDADEKLRKLLGRENLHGADGSIGAVFSWKRPANLGVREGRLAPCKRTPNCVSSQANPSDPEHYIAPIHGNRAQATQAVASMPRATIIEKKPDYLYAEFRSRLLRYIDDVELYFDGQVIHVRSCSRLGRRDFGVNRRRVEELRRLIEARR
jgi:uncharacterized protein (DUF1499 family)